MSRADVFVGFAVLLYVFGQFCGVLACFGVLPMIFGVPGGVVWRLWEAFLRVFPGDFQGFFKRGGLFPESVAKSSPFAWESIMCFFVFWCFSGVPGCCWAFFLGGDLI